MSLPNGLQASDRIHEFLLLGRDTLLPSDFFKFLGLHFKFQVITMTLWMSRECDNTSPWCTKYDTLLQHLEK